MKPVLIEESTLQGIPQHLETLLFSLGGSFQSADKNDVICVLLYVLMIETGFVPQNVMNSDLSKCGHDFSIQTLNSIRNMPTNWKNTAKNFYEIIFNLGKFTEHPCKLVILPTDDILIVDLVISNVNKQRKTYSITIEPTKYIQNPSHFNAPSFKNLKDLSLRFKNNVSHPAKCAVLTHEGFLNPSLLGVPDEIKIKILKKLKVQDFLKMSMVSHNFHHLCRDQGLWRHFLLRDYDSEDVREMVGLPRINEVISWKEEYKTRYELPKSTFSAYICYLK